MISNLFIERPRLAFVVSIVITLAGLIAMRFIPVAQFPDIVPPQVQVSATFPGASAEVVAEHCRGADRGAGRGRQQHALHAVDQRQ